MKKSANAPTGNPERCPDGDWQLHTPFCQLVEHCTHGIAPLGSAEFSARDHVAELSLLLGIDTDPVFWFKGTATNEGIRVRKIISTLMKRITVANDLAAARTVYAIATYTAFEILFLYLRERRIFDMIAPRRALLPCLASIHPNTPRVMATMRKDSRLGTQTPEPHTIGSRGWFTSNAPANVYARAIITSIELNQHLDPWDKQQKTWARFDKINGCKTRLLPLPKYINGIDQLLVPISPETVLEYWRKGKEMILEEIPGFHLRPEWESYRKRQYQHGAKKGAIQHAIFKDILAALRTIAGANKEMKNSSLGKRARGVK